MGLLDVADVIREDGPWSVGTAGEQLESRGCATQSWLDAVCDATAHVKLAGGADGATTSAIDAPPFAVTITLRQRTRCEAGDERAYVTDALDVESEKAVASVLWDGLPYGTSSHLAETWLGGGSGVATAPAGSNIKDAVANGLDRFYDNTVGVRPTLHLGLRAVLDLTSDVTGGQLSNAEVPVVVSPGYPLGAVAVSGPVRVHLGEINSIRTDATATNRVLLEATRLASVVFDPCQAVYVAG